VWTIRYFPHSIRWPQKDQVILISYLYILGFEPRTIASRPFFEQILRGELIKLNLVFPRLIRTVINTNGDYVWFQCQSFRNLWRQRATCSQAPCSGWSHLSWRNHTHPPHTHSPTLFRNIVLRINVWAVPLDIFDRSGHAIFFLQIINTMANWLKSDRIYLDCHATKLLKKLVLFWAGFTGPPLQGRALGRAPL